MAEQNSRSERERETYARRIARAEQRKIRARREKDRRIWFGLGMFGVIGWSITVPILLGLALGLWLDAMRPSSYSWTLICLAGGVLLGIWNAWYWVSREQEAIARARKELNEALRQEGEEDSHS